MHHADVDELLRSAIRERRLVSFILDERPRLAEPHDYGLIDGEPCLFFYQVGGESRSGRPLGWRWARLAKLSELHTLEDRFAGTRAVPSERHIRWDELFATVSARMPSAKR